MMQRYEKYKNSGVDWIGEIPEHWKILPGLSFIYENKAKNKGMIRNTVLSLSYGKIRVKAESELTGLVPESFETYQLVNVGDLIFRPTDLQNDMVSLRSSISEYEGIITSAYLNLKFKENANPKFFHYFFRGIDNNKIIYGLGSGLRQNISYLDFRRFNFPFPPIQEQQIIAAFLDDKTAKIDKTIAIKEKEIELLKERRQILIQKAVTKGLDDTVKLKDSGVDWIGEIPEHWEVRKLKQVCKINLNSLDEKTNANYEFEYIDIGSVTYENGIINKEYFLFKNAPSRARRIAKEGDTIVSTVRTYLKAIDFIDKSKSEFIYSTGFAVLQPHSNVYPKYLFSFIKSDAFTEQVSVNSKGMSYPAINSTELGVQKVLHLPLEEQTQIVSYLEKIEEKIAKAILLKQQEIEKLKEYKTVLIDNVVTGKVKVS